MRINPVSSGLAEEDLAAVLGAKRLPDALVVPKVETQDEVAWILDRVQAIVAKGRPRQLVCDSGSGSGGGGSTNGSSAGIEQQWRRPVAFIPMCESAWSILNLRWVHCTLQWRLPVNNLLSVCCLMSLCLLLCSCHGL